MLVFSIQWLIRNLNLKCTASKPESVSKCGLLCPDRIISLPLRLCWTKPGTHANTETGTEEKVGVEEKKEKPIEDREVERMECERRQK